MHNLKAYGKFVSDILGYGQFGHIGQPWSHVLNMIMSEHVGCIGNFLD